MDWESGVSRWKLLHLEWRSNEVLLCSTGNYIQSLVIEHDGEWYEKKNDWVTLLYSRNWHNIVKSTIISKRKKERSSHRGSVDNESD